MLRMSFMEHLEELRGRIIRALYGLGMAFVLSLGFANKLWDFVSDPAVEALKHLHVNPPMLAQLTPMEGFSVIWVELPLLASVFLASPWIVYQVWAFISPGLYKKERRLAMPFVLLTAGLFIGGRMLCLFSGLPLRSRISARHRHEQQRPAGGLHHRIFRSVRQRHARRRAGVRIAGGDISC
jgi:sec-independent protein translocase protein TatC